MQSFSRYGARFTSGVYGVHLIPAMHAGMHVAGSGGDDVVVRARRATRAHHAMDGCRHGQAPCVVVRVSHVAACNLAYPEGPVRETVKALQSNHTILGWSQLALQ